MKTDIMIFLLGLFIIALDWMTDKKRKNDDDDKPNMWI